MVSKLNDHPGAAVRIDADQFEELKDMLRPGFELASAMLADYQAQKARADKAPQSARRSKRGQHPHPSEA